MALTFPGLSGLVSGLNNAPGMSRREERAAQAKRLLDAQKIEQDRFEFERSQHEFERFQQRQDAPFRQQMLRQQVEQSRLATEQQKRDLQLSKRAEFNKQFDTMRANAAKIKPTMNFNKVGQAAPGLAARSTPTVAYDPHANLRNQVEANELRKQLRAPAPGYGPTAQRPPAPGYGPTAQRLAEGRASKAARPRSSASRGSSGGGGAEPPRQSPSAPMGEKFGRRTGAGPPPGFSALGGGAKPSLGAFARRRPGAAAPTWTPKPSTPGQAPRGASPMLPNPVLGGGNVQSQPWAGDVYDRNRRGSEGPMTSGGITPDITPTGPVTRGSSPKIPVSNPGAAANPGRYGGFAGGFPKKPASVVQGRSSSSSRSRGGK